MLAWGSRDFLVEAVTVGRVGRGLIPALGLYATLATVQAQLVPAALPAPNGGFAFAIVPVADEVESVLWLLFWHNFFRPEVIHIEA